jgi:DNA topoisomerase-1
MVTPIDINEYLKSFMKELTAKLFRTYNATNLFKIEISKIIKKYKDYKESDRVEILIKEFNKANLKVAITLNH